MTIDIYVCSLGIAQTHNYFKFDSSVKGRTVQPDISAEITFLYSLRLIHLQIGRILSFLKVYIIH